MVDCLLKYGADVNFHDVEAATDILPLMQACECEDIAMVNYLLKLGANTDMVCGNGKSILGVAVESGNTQVVQCLLEAKANLEIKSGLFLNFTNTPVASAVMNNDTEMVTFLVKQGAKTKPIKKLDRHKIHPKMVKFLKIRKYL